MFCVEEIFFVDVVGGSCSGVDNREFRKRYMGFCSKCMTLYDLGFYDCFIGIHDCDYIYSSCSWPNATVQVSRFAHNVPRIMRVPGRRLPLVPAFT